MPNQQPQPWNPAQVRLAVNTARRLAEAVVADHTGDAYRQELDGVLEEVFGDEMTQQQVADEIAYLLYGAAMFGAGALAIAEAAGGVTHEAALAQLVQALDTWLGQLGNW